VNKAIDKEKVEIGDRIIKLRKLLSLSQNDLGLAIGVSVPTIVAIETGIGFTGDYFIAISHFFGMTLSELTSLNLPLPDEVMFREKLETLHKKQNPQAYKILIENKPTLKVIIHSRLLKTDFLKDNYRRVKEINDFLKENYGLNYKSSILSEALATEYEMGFLKRNKSGRYWLYGSNEIK
jgi:transcriptional regulator with XRE-family HTH domain